jgi:adenylate cyclase
VPLGSTSSPIVSFVKATNNLNKAFSLDKDNSDAYLVLGTLYLWKKQHDKAIAAGERAVTLNPNGADAYCQLGYILHCSGRSDEAIELFNKAIRLNPIPPTYYFYMLGHAYRTVGRYEESIDLYKKSLSLEPNAVFARVGLAVTYFKVGRKEEAHNEAEEILKIDPNFSLKYFEKTQPHINQDYLKDQITILRKLRLE